MRATEMIGWGVLLTIVIIWAVIYPVTDYWQRWFSPSVIKKGSPREPKICLTFDDGPNPEITPQVLDILAQNHISATFFLVGSRAERSPGLVQRILADGHEIGLHTFLHRHAYGMFLKKSIRTIRQGKIVLEKISGRSISWFRPPWGALNLFEYLELKRLKLKVVLWTANAVDWDLRTTPAQIVENLLNKLTPGCIIVIHDAGGDPGAPRNMLKALPEIIRQCQTKGYRFETLTNITGGIETA
jgi:peptidoglycan/xylan/chitin deacetylase (PgdA/CDA1 family)